MATQKVKIRIEPRPHFREFLESTKRWAVLVAHRRAGKTVAVVQKLIRCALTHSRKGPPLRYAYIAPTRDQAKDIAWAYLKDYCEKIPGTTINESELKITLFNRAVIRLYSGENYERMRGLYFDGIVSDEDADIPPAAFDYVILPCLLDYNGWHTRIGTPKGRNAFYKAYTSALNDPDSFTLMLKASESGILSPESLKAIREKTTADSYAQEMECDFNVGRPGAIYAKLVEQAYREKRICNFPVADTLVHTSWDLGSPTNTTVWYWQVVGREIRLIDCDVGLIEGVETITQRVSWMMKKGYAYGKHFLPHDAAQTERGGSSFEREIRAAGLASVIVLKRCVDIWTGINGLKGLFPSLVIHAERCAKGIEALEAYHTREVDIGRIINNEPVHDWSSHSCFLGSTKVLTRYGMRRIDELPCTGIIMTSQGWKKYTTPTITRKNAPLVEVTFTDGYTVKCTPDHLFKTGSKWTSAENLQKGLMIQSIWMSLPNTSTASYIGYGLEKITCLVEEVACIAMYGLRLLGQFQPAVTSIIGMKTRSIIASTIWNASLLDCTTSNITKSSLLEHSHKKPETKRQNGINQKREGFGTKGMLRGLLYGLNGSVKKGRVFTVVKSLIALFAEMGGSKNIATQTAKRCTIESVKHLNETADVWCLATEVGDFALANGAIVKNCDAIRYMAEAIQQGHIKIAQPMVRSMEEMDFEYGFSGKRRELVQDTGGM